MTYKLERGIAFPTQIYLHFDDSVVLIWTGQEFRDKEELDESYPEAYRYCYDNYERIVEEVKSFIVKDML